MLLIITLLLQLYLNYYHLFLEYAGNIGDASNPAGQEAEQQKLLHLVEKF